MCRKVPFLNFFMGLVILDTTLFSHKIWTIDNEACNIYSFSPRTISFPTKVIILEKFDGGIQCLTSGESSTADVFVNFDNLFSDL